MPRVKICGLRRERDVRVAIAAGADAVGFVTDVDVDTPREVSPAWAAALAEAASPLVTTVAVTMPDGVDDAVALVEQVSPDAVQIHGEFSEDEVNDLTHRVDVDVLVAVDADDADRVRDLEGTADALVVDSLTDDGAGGTGETGDWEAVERLVLECSTPIVLAGGLTPDNVAEAVETARPFAVDVSSGVEIPDGEGAKDDEAIRHFCAAAGRGLEFDRLHPGGPGA